MLGDGSATFVIEIPATFRATWLRGAKPSLLVEADATDPAAAPMRSRRCPIWSTLRLRDDLTGPLAARAAAAPSFGVVIHNLYNPEANTQYNIVPGLLGVILTMTMVMATSIALTLSARARHLRKLAGDADAAGRNHDRQGGAQYFVGAGRPRSSFPSPIRVPRSDDRIVHPAGGRPRPSTSRRCSRSATPSPPSPGTRLQAMQMTFFVFCRRSCCRVHLPFRGMPFGRQWIGEAMPITHFCASSGAFCSRAMAGARGLADVWPMISLFVRRRIHRVRRFRKTWIRSFACS